MATVTKSIGTASRDYSTINLWEADLDDTGIYSSADDAIGEMYNDSVFTDQNIFLNGGGTVGLNSVTLRAASGEEHDGTEGSGARMVYTKNQSLEGIEFNQTFIFVLDAIEIDAAGFELGGAGVNSLVYCSAVTSDANRPIIRRNLLHGMYTTNNSAIGIRLRVGGNILRNIIYDIEVDRNSASAHARGIDTESTARELNVMNNTVHDVRNNQGSGHAICLRINFGNTNKYTVQNNIGTDPSGSTSGTKACYDVPPAATEDHNLSSDATAAGTGSLINKASSDQFVSTTSGSEDLHLKTGADAIDAGTDLVTTPSGVEIDIDGRDVDSEADTWDMGADEFVAIGGGRVPPKRHNLDYMLVR